MQSVLDFINGIQAYILFGLVLCIVILSIFIVVLLKGLNQLEKKYRKFMRGVNNKSLEELVIGYLDKIDKMQIYTEQVKQSNDVMNQKLIKCIQKVDIIRFKAFEDVGSDLSFSVAMLDNNDDGVILTGIYGRNESTTYAKPINKGVSRYDLSHEEKTVLDNAINKR
jgi:hypothetical protein